MTAQDAELTAGFWAAAGRRQLVRPVCGSCGRSFFTPQVACPYCLGEAWSYRASSGRGTLYSSTVVHRPPSPGFPAPFRLAVVDLDEGWSMLANLVEEADGPAPDIGARVRVTWIQRDGRTLPAFTSAPGTGPP